MEYTQKPTNQTNSPPRKKQHEEMLFKKRERRFLKKVRFLQVRAILKN